MRNPPRNRDRFGILEVFPGANYTDDEIEFMVAMDRKKRTLRRPFPTWREVLQWAKEIGYQKVSPPPSS